MKKIFALLCVATLVLACFVACDKEKDKNKKPTEQPTKQEFNQFAAIYLPAVENETKSGTYSAMDVYEYATFLMFTTEDIPGLISYGGMTIGGEAFYHYRDTVAKEIALKGIHILTQDSENSPWRLGNFIERRDIVATAVLDEDGSLFDLTIIKSYDPDNLDEDTWKIVNHWRDAVYAGNVDTIAYIPNAIMDSMQPLIEKAFEEGYESEDWSNLLYLFRHGYKLIPITGSAYMELVKEGKN